MIQIYVDIIPIVLFYCAMAIIATTITTVVLAFYAMQKRKTKLSYAILSVWRNYITLVIVNIVFGMIGLIAFLMRDVLATTHGPGTGEIITAVCILVIILFTILWILLRRKQIKGGKFYWREGGMRYSPWG